MPIDKQRLSEMVVNHMAAVDPQVLIKRIRTDQEALVAEIENRVSQHQAHLQTMHEKTNLPINALEIEVMNDVLLPVGPEAEEMPTDEEIEVIEAWKDLYLESLEQE